MRFAFAVQRVAGRDPVSDSVRPGLASDEAEWTAPVRLSSESVTPGFGRWSLPSLWNAGLVGLDRGGGVLCRENRSRWCVLSTPQVPLKSPQRTWQFVPIKAQDIGD
jgi:hypothetical protein